MNHEEIFHLRDGFLRAALTGLCANPNVVKDLETKPLTVVSLANRITNRLLDERTKYYAYEDAKEVAQENGLVLHEVLVAKEK